MALGKTGEVMETKHTHQFAVDAACDCGAMISEVVRKLASDNAALIAALEEARMQLEYLDGKFPTGTTAAVLTRIGVALNAAKHERAPMG